MIATLVFFPLIAAILQLLLVNIYRNQNIKIIQLFLCVIFFVISLSLFFFGENISVINVANWPAPYGISLVYDELSSLMIVIFSLVFLSINIYSFNEFNVKASYCTFYSGSWFLFLGTIGALLTYDIFNLYVWSEVILVSSCILLSNTKENNIVNTWNYFVFNICGTLLILMSIAFIYGTTGFLNNLSIYEYIKLNPESLDFAVLLLFLGLGIKGGLFPFYFWLPKNYASTSSSSLMLMSSFVTKVMMLVILKLIWLWYPNGFFSSVFVFLACMTMFFGVMGAASEYKFTDILTFHIVSQLGYILLAIFISSTTAIIAALYFIIHNIFVKTCLIMTARIIEDNYQSNLITNMGEALKSSPLLSLIFFISAMSLAGFPPLSGFWGKFFIFQSAFNDKHYISLAFAIVVSLFTLFSMIKIWKFVFCQSNEQQCQVDNFSLGYTNLLALSPLILCPVLIGVFPDLIFGKLHSIADHISNPDIAQSYIFGAQK